jgi:formate hydrogenlyase transcriptional activator
LPPPPPAEPVCAVPGSEALDTTLRGSERALILNTLTAVRWVVGGSSGAAARLGMNRSTLIARMKKLGISRPGGMVVPLALEDTAAVDPAEV